MILRCRGGAGHWKTKLTTLAAFDGALQALRSHEDGLLPIQFPPWTHSIPQTRENDPNIKICLVTGEYPITYAMAARLLSTMRGFIVDYKWWSQASCTLYVMPQGQNWRTAVGFIQLSSHIDDREDYGIPKPTQLI